MTSTITQTLVWHCLIHCTASIKMAHMISKGEVVTCLMEADAAVSNTQDRQSWPDKCCHAVTNFHMFCMWKGPNHLRLPHSVSISHKTSLSLFYHTILDH